MQVKWNELPLELEALSPEEQVKSVVGNLADAVHWRANLTRSAMLMQFGPEAHKQENQPLKFLQDAVMNNPQLLSAGAGLPGLSRQEPKPGGSQQCEANDQDLVQQLFKNADPALQGLLNVPQALLDALNEGSLTQ